jgi:4-diphosphocytidyl-2-C-methyl-D-erythritol kinase
MADLSVESYRINAPAKINLHLRVGPPTADGFHPLLSWMATVGLFDILEFRLVDGSGVELSCDVATIACDASNLVVKAAAAMLERLGASGGAKQKGVGSVGVVAALQKRIPIGAGLGGGSSDGAFTLKALDQLLGLNTPREVLSELAARFGSDLSFFLHGSSSICTGRGEVVKPIATPRPRWVVLILPGIHMATPAVYRRFDEMKLGNIANLEHAPDWRAWVALEARELLPRLVNDLEAPAFSLSPALAELHARASVVAGRIVRMSGSGSSLFTLCDDANEAERIAAQLRLTLEVDARAVELCPGESAIPR